MLKEQVLRHYVRERLSPGRYLHSLRTAATLRDLMLRFRHIKGQDLRDKPGEKETLNRGVVAGLVHDIARELSHARIRSIAEQDGLPILPEDESNPILLHGRAAAVMMKTEWGVEDEELLQALRWHTVGEVGMGSLGMLLLIADYIEPGRQHIDDEFRAMVLDKKDLAGMMMVVLEDQCEYNKKRGREISRRTERVIAALREDRCAVVQAG